MQEKVTLTVSKTELGVLLGHTESVEYSDPDDERIRRMVVSKLRKAWEALEKVPRGKIKWVVEIGVDKCWIEDGFEVTKERVEEMLQRDLQFATGSEVSARVLSSPDKKVIKKIQGG